MIKDLDEEIILDILVGFKCSHMCHDKSEQTHTYRVTEEMEST